MSLRKIADYTIVRELGRGGMGAVFHALSPSGITVALKTVTWPDRSDARRRWEAIERFQREARAARALSHPNVCQVLDFGADGDTLFIVMEFLDGQTLRELIHSAGAIRLERAVQIAAAVCEALAYAHEHGVTHRDVKPENIMLLRTGEVKLTDFGLASVAAEGTPAEGPGVLGTLSYMAPEQVRGEGAQAASDIFSLGATLYEMLTGERAFSGEQPAAVVHQILTADPPPVPGLPEHVAQALRRCLRKPPRERFQSAREVADALLGRESAPRTDALLEAPRVVTPTPTPPVSLPPIWNVPHRRNPTFTGREELLSRIASALAAGGPAALTQAIVGLGGVGKTQCALEYAYRHAGDYQTIWWVRAEEPAQLASDYAALAVPLDLPQQQTPDQSVVVSAVRQWLERNTGWLLILDSAPGPSAVKDYLPRTGGGHVLITSRDQNWGRAATAVAVPVLPQAEAVALLEQRTRWSGPAVGRLAEELGYLPLALEQAAAYAAATGCTVTAYLELFHSRRQALLQRGESPEGYQGTVASTWSLSMAKAGVECPAAAQLLDLCAHLAPEAIPLSLVQEGAEHLPEPLASTARDPLLLHDAVAALRRYSLITVHQEALSVHRLVQAVVRDGLSAEEQREWAGAAVRLLYAICLELWPEDHPSWGDEDVRAWPQWALLLPHALAATELAIGLEAAVVETGRLLSRAGTYLNQRGEWDQSEACLARAVEVVERGLGPDHPELSARLEDAALGGYAGGRALVEQALSIAERALGPDHPDVARRLLSLGRGLRWQRNEGLRVQTDYARARDCFGRALAIAEQTQGPDGPLVGEALAELAPVLVALGDTARAQACAERALAIAEQVYGPDHPTVASRHSTLGSVLADVGDFAGQKTEYEHALAIDEKVYGPDGIQVAWDAAALAGAMLRLGEGAEAKGCAQRRLAILEEAYGPVNDHRINVLGAFGRLLQELGEPELAKAAFDGRLTIAEKYYRPDVPFFVLHPLASVLLDLGDLEGAQCYLEWAQSIAAKGPGQGDFRWEMGPEREGPVSMLPTLGRLRRLQGRLEEAKTALEESLATPELLGLRYPGRIAATHLEYGLTLQAMGDPAGARDHLAQAVALSERQLGPKHPRTEKARRALAELSPQ